MGEKTAANLRPVWGSWEPGTVAVMRRLVRPGATVFDVGAHIGYYTTLLSELVGPTGSVHAFEPHPGNREVLARNTRELDNVTIVPAAVSHQIERRSLHFSSNSGRHSLFRSKFTSPVGAATDVDCVTLDSYWESIGRPRTDLIKIDVEGAEASAVSGATELLGTTRGISVVSEYYPANLRAAGQEPHEFLDRLARLGLTVQTILDDGTLRPGIPELSGEDYVNVLLSHDQA